MSRDEKVLFWVEIVHKWMRLTGEDGEDEISVFTPELISKFRNTDSEVDNFMSTVLTHIAEMWFEEPNEFISSVNLSMGTEYTVDEDCLNKYYRSHKSKPWWKFWR